MSCTLSRSLKAATGCTEFGFGGIDKILVGDKDLVTGVVATGSTVEAMSGTFFEYESQDQTANFTQELDASRKFYTQTVNITLEALSAEESDELEVLARVKRLVVLVRTSDQVWYAFGLNGKGLKCITQTDDSGTADTDLRTVVLALSGPNAGRYKEVESSVAEALMV